jgi:mannose-6-phosphate isomerase-like protein (cupin superfamily)
LLLSARARPSTVAEAAAGFARLTNFRAVCIVVGDVGQSERQGAYVRGPDAGKRLPLIGRLKVSASETGGAFEVIEYEGPASPPAHIHHHRDEAFFIQSGSFSFTLGSEAFDAGPGSVVFVPRGTRHGFSLNGGGRALLLIVPAGLEGFFEELGNGLEAGKSSDSIRAALAGRYDSVPAPDASK